MMAEGILTVNLPAKGKKWWKFTVCMLAGAFCGAGLGHTIGRYLKHSHKVSHVSASDIGALTLTAFYIGAAFLVLWFARDRMRLARYWKARLQRSPQVTKKSEAFATRRSSWRSPAYSWLPHSSVSIFLAAAMCIERCS